MTDKLTMKLNLIQTYINTLCTERTAAKSTRGIVLFCFVLLFSSIIYHYRDQSSKGQEGLTIFKKKPGKICLKHKIVQFFQWKRFRKKRIKCSFPRDPVELSGTNIYQQICNLSAFLPFSSELRFYLAARIRCYTPDRLSNEFRPLDWGGQSIKKIFFRPFGPHSGHSGPYPRSATE